MCTKGKEFRCEVYGVAYKIFYRRWSWPFVAQHRAHFVSQWCYVTLRFPWQRVPWSTHYTKERLCSGVLNMALLWITKERPEGSPVCHAWWEVEPWSPLAHHHLIHKHNRDKWPLLPNLPGVMVSSPPVLTLTVLYGYPIAASSKKTVLGTYSYVATANRNPTTSSSSCSSVLNYKLFHFQK